MTRERRIKVMTYWHKFPEAMAIAVLTAVTTIVLALVLSVVAGGESRATRAATRCYAAQTHEMIREIIENAPSLDGLVDMEDYPPVNTEGLECDTYFLVPISEEALP